MRIPARRRRSTFFAASLVLLAAAHAVGGEPGKTAPASPAPGDWPQFLGPARNGVSPETGLMTTWPHDGPPEVWRVRNCQGLSGPAIGEGRLFTLVQSAKPLVTASAAPDGERQWLLCLDAKTGAAHWQTDLAPAYRNAMGNGPRATPALAGDVVYALTGEGILAAARITDGQIVWKKNILAEFGGKPAEYGMACSPLVVGERVIVTIGAPQATVVALKCKTGDVAWTAGKDQPAGYSSPALLTVGGREQLVVFHGAAAMGLDPGNGALLWNHPYITDFNCNIATPQAVDGGVFLSAGENHGSELISLKARGDKFEVGQVWSSQGPKSVMRNEWQTSIVLDDSLYGFDNVGGAGPITHFACIDAKTGERRWQQPRFGKGNMIAADGKLFMTTVQGELVVLKANPQKFEELGRKVIVGKTRQPPALAAGLLYLRDDGEIVCLDVRQR